MINNVRELFGRDIDKEMAWSEFNSKLELPEMVCYFDFLDVDQSDARALFTLIDTDNSGTVNCEEFLNSCLRLKGPAKALDHQILMREVGEISIILRDVKRDFDRQMNFLRDSVERQTSGQQEGESSPITEIFNQRIHLSCSRGKGLS